MQSFAASFQPLVADQSKGRNTRTVDPALAFSITANATTPDKSADAAIRYPVSVSIELVEEL
ncbi:hypothetical protein D3C85_1595770 [compost metagenome]